MEMLGVLWAKDSHGFSWSFHVQVLCFQELQETWAPHTSIQPDLRPDSVLAEVVPNKKTKT